MNRLAVSVLLFLLPAAGQATKQDDMKDCPTPAQHAAEKDKAAMESHHDQAMGLAHDKTRHYFRMTADGGVIEVTVKDPSDKANTKAIRSHLMYIAKMFSHGDFSTSMFIHDGVPPGVTTMKLLKSDIHYTYEQMPTGGRVRVQSDNPIAVAAIHDFLRFHITEHKTGASLEIHKP